MRGIWSPVLSPSRGVSGPFIRSERGDREMANPPDVRARPRPRSPTPLSRLLTRLLGEAVTVSLSRQAHMSGLTGGDGEYLKAVVDEIGRPVLLVGHSRTAASVITAGRHGLDNVVGSRLHLRVRPGRGREPDRPPVQVPGSGDHPVHRGAPVAGGGNEFTLAPEGFHESFCADIRPMTSRSTRSPSVPSPVSRSPRRRRPRPGATVRSGRCFRPRTSASTPACTASATTAWARR